MQYDPIKKMLGRFFSGSLFMRKTFYSLLDLLLLRTWHVKKALKKAAGHFEGETLVLDAGCGFGQYSWRMANMNRRWKIEAIDIDSEHIKDCASFFEKAGLSERTSFRTGDLTLLSEKDRYDLILSVDVMEHIGEDTRVFENFHKALKADGTLIISTPSDKGGSDVHNENDDSFIGEHVRDGYSINDITGKLSSAGFSNVEVAYTYGVPGTISWRLSMKYPIKMLNFSSLFFILIPFWYLIFFPFSFLLNFADLSMKHKEGTGLLVTARK
ncbi:MAG: methyltransferase type 11 [Bacteroidetes bacterium GWF2_41_9]|nr:MAG: methyltransferase type 11 [Bacteroidetes bacterium GWF2_41_9]HAM08897.1 methyltransferase type 11 [Bacteroidales bacterium]